MLTYVHQSSFAFTCVHQKKNFVITTVFVNTPSGCLVTPPPPRGLDHFGKWVGSFPLLCASQVTPRQLSGGEVSSLVLCESPHPRGAPACRQQLHDLLRNYSVPSVLGAYRLLPHLRRAPRNAGAVSRLRLPRHRHPNVTQWCLAVKRANRERNLGCGGVAPNVLHYTAPCPVR